MTRLPKSLSRSRGSSQVGSIVQEKGLIKADKLSDEEIWTIHTLVPWVIENDPGLRARWQRFRFEKMIGKPRKDLPFYAWDFSDQFQMGGIAWIYGIRALPAKEQRRLAIQWAEPFVAPYHQANPGHLGADAAILAAESMLENHQLADSDRQQISASLQRAASHSGKPILSDLFFVLLSYEPSDATLGVRVHAEILTEGELAKAQCRADQKYTLLATLSRLYSTTTEFDQVGATPKFRISDANLMLLRDIASWVFQANDRLQEEWDQRRWGNFRLWQHEPSMDWGPNSYLWKRALELLPVREQRWLALRFVELVLPIYCKANPKDTQLPEILVAAWGALPSSRQYNKDIPKKTLTSINQRLKQSMKEPLDKILKEDPYAYTVIATFAGVLSPDPVEAVLATLQRTRWAVPSTERQTLLEAQRHEILLAITRVYTDEAFHGPG